ncbi:conserved hypothetical protein [Talaromyces stipitatus ATCC 10500]|uniref:GPI anchored cell wall protein n=1 Tax=Talaromyces stipitatus (strain ATCC 10500 / CBS 375.48 / QM 6759 / NRRL 1006) TaxID=441959 RepID=B8MKX6_TALSN|nr:uncharacterized protein TSTA_044410 [Talaromyces stipitatus ATCC 10500]EED14975.1 conserved hypothetical protein [Talaromyces stipitatus ATCC 10500]
MRSTTFAVTALGMAALATAQDGLISNSKASTPSPTTFASGTTTIKIFEAGETGLDPSGYAGSIININAAATTVLLNCVDPNDENCQSGITMTAGASTWGYQWTTEETFYGYPVTVVAKMGCNVISSTQEATCVVTAEATASAEGQKTTSISSTTTVFPSKEITYEALLITAGVEKLASPQATATPKGAGAVVAPPVPTGSFKLGGMAAAAKIKSVTDFVHIHVSFTISDTIPEDAG